MRAVIVLEMQYSPSHGAGAYTDAIVLDASGITDPRWIHHKVEECRLAGQSTEHVASVAAVFGVKDRSPERETAWYTPTQLHPCRSL
jgi:hypothetical protein